MMTNAPSPEVKSAITLGVIAETVLLGIGGTVAFVTGEMFWIMVFALAGSAVLLFLLARVGAFNRSGE